MKARIRSGFFRVHPNLMNVNIEEHIGARENLTPLVEFDMRCP